MGSQPHFDLETSVPILTDRVENPAAGSPRRAPALVAEGADRIGYLPPTPKRRGIRFGKFYLFLLVLLLLALGAAYYEAQTSTLQSRYLPEYASRLKWEVQDGPSDSILFPNKGPFDQRLGYVRLPIMLEKLQNSGMQLDRQVRFSPDLMQYLQAGFYLPYNEKTQAGLEILDRRLQPMYHYYYPRRHYDTFETVPTRMVSALLFIENRKLLDTDFPRTNPAVDWGRFIKAAVFKAGDAINIKTPSMGGSTLATQIEKYRHSDDGITSSIEDKLVQMASASVRVYQQGPDTMNARRKLVLDYLNTVPLSAAPGYGEVNGIGDGLFVWFGSDFDRINKLLNGPDLQGEELMEQGTAMRQIIALMIAHRRPSYYLAQSNSDLNPLTDSYLRLLGRKGAIGEPLMQAALAQKTVFRDFRAKPAVIPQETNKGVNVARNRLVSSLDASLYDLDRMDLTATTTLQGDLQDAVTNHLRKLHDNDFAQQNGLVGEYLLKPNQAKFINYSFTLFERTPNGNQVRVQTDNTDNPFDINEGSKLELGSTAKLRVLTTYLEVMAEIHTRYQNQSAETLTKLRADTTDVLTGWVLDQMIGKPDLLLPELLQRALDRTYSANPGERFFTGGGVHTFNNFKKEDNGRIPTVRESLQESINLPFVRMLRELVNYTTYQKWSGENLVRLNDSDPRRREVLAKFIDRESTVFLSRFWVKYQGMSQQERMDAFLTGLKPTPVRLTVVHRYLFPSADLNTFSAFLKDRLPGEALTAKTVNNLYERYKPGSYNLQDQGYLARVHPLELWLLGYLQQAEKPSFSAALASSAEERQQVYSWLLRTKAKNARDTRVRTMLEVEAFSDIHRRWKAVGYPFDHLVPSLASALGSSGDRPAALAELMGIILNGGERMPVYRLDKLVFGAGTPYEARLSQQPMNAVQVLNPDVADALKGALGEVVNKGTARRLQGAYHKSDGGPLNMGGKTGTGDNRLVSMGAGGQRTKGRALSRTATLVFYLGDNHFGTLTAFVSGSGAGDFRFTSALPAQTLKGMAPILEPYLQQAETPAELAPEMWHDGYEDEPPPPVQAAVDGAAAVEAVAEPGPDAIVPAE